MAALCEDTRHFTLFFVSSSLCRIFKIENRRRIPIGISHYFSKMAALRPLFIVTSYILTLCAISNMQLYRPPLPPPTPILPIQSHNTSSPTPTTPNMSIVFMFISYKAISSPLVAPVTSAAAVRCGVCRCSGDLGRAGVEIVLGEGGGDDGCD